MFDIELRNCSICWPMVFLLRSSSTDTNWELRTDARYWQQLSVRAQLDNLKWRQKSWSCLYHWTCIRKWVFYLFKLIFFPGCICFVFCFNAMLLLFVHIDKMQKEMRVFCKRLFNLTLKSSMHNCDPVVQDRTAEHPHLPGCCCSCSTPSDWCFGLDL